uniref:Fe-S_biosyn domain-containing protein n=1 Tax=Heligmosomoides polygyrus TaxID=6339 RepID=A0A183GNP8_HELPZ
LEAPQAHMQADAGGNSTSSDCCWSIVVFNVHSDGNELFDFDVKSGPQSSMERDTAPVLLGRISSLVAGGSVDIGATNGVVVTQRCGCSDEHDDKQLASRQRSSLRRHVAYL